MTDHRDPQPDHRDRSQLEARYVVTVTRSPLGTPTAFYWDGHTWTADPARARAYTWNDAAQLAEQLADDAQTEAIGAAWCPPVDPSKSPATQPYRTTSQAQQVARQLDPNGYLPSDTAPGSMVPRCPYCHTPHATQADADACQANDLEHSARVLGRILGGI